MIKPILWMALAGASGALDHPPGPDEVSYVSEAASFRAHLGAGQFVFHDGRAAQTVSIKPCNDKIIREFWTDLVAHAQMLASDPARAAEGPRGATLKLGSTEIAVGRYDSLYYYFNRMPKDSAVVLIQSLRSCHETL